MRGSYLWLAEAAYAHCRLDSLIARPTPNCVLTTSLVKISPVCNRIVSRGPGSEERQRRSCQERAEPWQSGGSGTAVATASPPVLESSFRLRPGSWRLLPGAPPTGGPSALLDLAELTPRRGRDMTASGGLGPRGVGRLQGLQGGAGGWPERPQGAEQSGRGECLGEVCAGRWWAGPVGFPWTLSLACLNFFDHINYRAHLHIRSQGSYQPL